MIEGSGSGLVDPDPCGPKTCGSGTLVNGAGWCSGELLSNLKNTGNVNGIILPGVQAGRWKVINLFSTYLYNFWKNMTRECQNDEFFFSV